MRLWLASMTLGIGYLLVYAGFHPRGPLSENEYALRPWRSLLNEDELAQEAAAARAQAAIDRSRNNVQSVATTRPNVTPTGRTY
jgi:hypothetical protein